MPILNVNANNPGQAGVKPNLVYIETNDSLATVMAVGYLTDVAVSFGFSSETMLLVAIKPVLNTDAALVWLAPSNVSGVWSAVLPPSAGGNNPGTVGQIGRYNTVGTELSGVDLIAGTNVTISNTAGGITINSTASGGGVDPGLQNQLAYYAANGSTLSGLAAVTWNGSALAAAGNIFAMAGGNIQSQGFIAADGIVRSGSDMQAGSSGQPGGFVSFPATTVNGTLELRAVDSPANFKAIISNAAMTSSDHTFTIPDIGGTADTSFILADAVASQTINSPVTLSGSNGLSVGGNVTAGHPGAGGIYIAVAPTAGMGNFQFAAADNSGNFLVTVSNASFAQTSTILVPDPGAGSANFILDKSSGTQFIDSPLDVTSGNLSVGFNGQQGNFNVYAPGNNLGSMAIIPNNNSGNFNITLTNDPFGQISSVAIPDPGVISTKFILRDATASQTINSPLAVTSGNLSVGINGVQGVINLTAPDVGRGTLSLRAEDNVGDVTITISNDFCLTDTVVRIPETGTSTTRFILQNTASAQNIDSELILPNGALTVGGDGAAGVVTVKPVGPTLGSLVLSPSNNAGDFAINVTNASFGQATTVTLPDPLTGTANFTLMRSTSPFVDGNVVQALGVQGVLGDAGFALKQVQGAAAAGGSATQNFVDAFCTATSVVVGNWVTQTNPGQILTIVPGVGSFDVTSTVDIGVGTFSYIITK